MFEHWLIITKNLFCHFIPRLLLLMVPQFGTKALVKNGFKRTSRIGYADKINNSYANMNILIDILALE